MQTQFKSHSQTPCFFKILPSPKSCINNKTMLISMKLIILYYICYSPSQFSCVTMPTGGCHQCVIYNRVKRIDWPSLSTKGTQVHKGGIGFVLKGFAFQRNANGGFLGIFGKCPLWVSSLCQGYRLFGNKEMTGIMRHSFQDHDYSRIIKLSVNLFCSLRVISLLWVLTVLIFAPGHFSASPLHDLDHYGSRCPLGESRPLTQLVFFDGCPGVSTGVTLIWFQHS